MKVCHKHTVHICSYSVPNPLILIYNIDTETPLLSLALMIFTKSNNDVDTNTTMYVACMEYGIKMLLSGRKYLETDQWGLLSHLEACVCYNFYKISKLCLGSLSRSLSRTSVDPPLACSYYASTPVSTMSEAIPSRKK